jgi:hypothetical protein
MSEPHDERLPSELPFVVELLTRQGKVSERFATYEEARRRVEQFPLEALISLPLIFRELADGSERVVREDGKPLQFHRVLVEDLPSGEDAPVPLAEGDSGRLGPDGKLKLVERHPEANWGEDLSLIDPEDAAGETGTCGPTLVRPGEKCA